MGRLVSPFGIVLGSEGGFRGQSANGESRGTVSAPQQAAAIGIFSVSAANGRGSFFEGANFVVVFKGSQEDNTIICEFPILRRTQMHFLICVCHAREKLKRASANLLYQFTARPYSVKMHKASSIVNSTPRKSAEATSSCPSQRKAAKDISAPCWFRFEPSKADMGLPCFGVPPFP